jgi:hypothetical protein
MMGITVQDATNVTEILNDRSSTHSDSNDFRYLEPFSCSSRFGQIGICLLKQFGVIFAQSQPTSHSITIRIFVDSLFAKQECRLSD